MQLILITVEVQTTQTIVTFLRQCKIVTRRISIDSLTQRLMKINTIRTLFNQHMASLIFAVELDRSESSQSVSCGLLWLREIVLDQNYCFYLINPLV